MKKIKVSIVLPAFNAEDTIDDVLSALSKLTFVNEVILVDDCSSDKTLEIADNWDIIIVKHEENLGYGGNQKTCYREAIKINSDIVVMFHPDYQYDIDSIESMVNLIKTNNYSYVLGSRIDSICKMHKQGMPFYKIFANRILTFFMNKITGINLSEWHTGLRAYSGEYIRSIPYWEFRNDFLFDTQMTIEAIRKEVKIGEISSRFSYNSTASVIKFTSALKYSILSLLFCIEYYTGKNKIL